MQIIRTIKTQMRMICSLRAQTGSFAGPELDADLVAAAVAVVGAVERLMHVGDEVDDEL